MIKGWIMKLLGIKKWSPPREMLETEQELQDALRRVDTEVNVRRDYSPHPHGKRNRDNMGSSSFPRAS